MPANLGILVCKNDGNTETGPEFWNLGTGTRVLETLNTLASPENTFLMVLEGSIYPAIKPYT